MQRERDLPDLHARERALASHRQRPELESGNCRHSMARGHRISTSTMRAMTGRAPAELQPTAMRAMVRDVMVRGDRRSAAGATTSSTSGASGERAAVATVCLAIAGSCAGLALATVAARAAGIATLAPGAAGIVAPCVLGRRRLAARLPAALDGRLAHRGVGSSGAACDCRRGKCALHRNSRSRAHLQ